MNVPTDRDDAAASLERKTWIDPVLEAFAVEELTEAFDGSGAEFGVFS